MNCVRCGSHARPKLRGHRTTNPSHRLVLVSRRVGPERIHLGDLADAAQPIVIRNRAAINFPP
jgi:hypothetical protein